jgi:hypothetical protein
MVTNKFFNSSYPLEIKMKNLFIVLVATFALAGCSMPCCDKMKTELEQEKAKFAAAQQQKAAPVEEVKKVTKKKVIKKVKKQTTKAVKAPTVAEKAADAVKDAAVDAKAAAEAVAQ